MKNIFYLYLLLSFLTINTCKTPYSPTPITTVSNYLVVEGMINISDSTYIKLSRTVNLASASTVKPETGAVITIESNAGTSYALTELGNGSYAAPVLNLSSTNKYRLRIKTSKGSQYLSDFGDTKVTPAIDTLTWQAKSDGLEIYASTHDPKNATHYYRWDYTEAWEFHPNFNSDFISNGDSIIARTPAQQIWDCYRGDASGNISLGTSIQLSQDVINQSLIAIVPQTDERISVKYSIQVKQYALTQDAFNYWTLLKKNTEQLGSIFDSQPSASIGNIHNVNNPAEPVIGYISAGTITKNRIFITKTQLPNWLATPFYPLCGVDTAWRLDAKPPRLTENKAINFKNPLFQGPAQIPVVPFGNPKIPDGYTAAEPICVDCTLRGSKTPPAYWK